MLGSLLHKVPGTLFEIQIKLNVVLVQRGCGVGIEENARNGGEQAGRTSFQAKTHKFGHFIVE